MKKADTYDQCAPKTNQETFQAHQVPDPSCSSNVAVISKHKHILPFIFQILSKKVSFVICHILLFMGAKEKQESSSSKVGQTRNDENVI